MSIDVLFMYGKTSIEKRANSGARFPLQVKVSWQGGLTNGKKEHVVMTMSPESIHWALELAMMKQSTRLCRLGCEAGDKPHVFINTTTALSFSIHQVVALGSR